MANFPQTRLQLTQPDFNPLWQSIPQYRPPTPQPEQDDFGTAFLKGIVGSMQQQAQIQAKKELMTQQHKYDMEEIAARKQMTPQEEAMFNLQQNLKQQQVNKLTRENEQQRQADFFKETYSMGNELLNMQDPEKKRETYKQHVRNLAERYGAKFVRDRGFTMTYPGDDALKSTMQKADQVYGISGANQLTGIAGNIRDLTKLRQIAQATNDTETLKAVDNQLAQLGQAAGLGPGQIKITDPRTGKPIIEMNTGEQGAEVRQGLTTAGVSKTQDKLQGLQESLSDLNKIKEDFNKVGKEYLTYGGKFRKGAAAVSEKLSDLPIIGQTGVGEAVGRGLTGMDKEERKAYLQQADSLFTRTEQLFNQYRKNITGAAASEKELQFLKKSFLNGDIAPSEFESRLNNLTQKIEDGIKAAGGDLQQGVRLDEGQLNQQQRQVPPQEEFIQRFLDVNKGASQEDAINFYNNKYQSKQTPGPQSMMDQEVSPPLGTVSAKYESGGRGAGVISTGAGDPGGKSYGTHQLASKTGTLQAFLRKSDYGDEFQGLRPGSAQFDRKWKQLAANDPGFAQAQHEFIKNTHFEPVRDHADKLGLPDTRAINEALFSIGVQHGGAKKILEKANINENMSEEQILRRLYQARTRYVNNLRLPAATKRSIRNRYIREFKDVMRLAQGGVDEI